MSRLTPEHQVRWNLSIQKCTNDFHFTFFTLFVEYSPDFCDLAISQLNSNFIKNSMQLQYRGEIATTHYLTCCRSLFTKRFVQTEPRSKQYRFTAVKLSEQS